MRPLSLDSGCSWQAVPELVCVSSSLVSTSNRSTEGLMAHTSLQDTLGLADSPRFAVKASSDLRPSLTSLGARQTLHFFGVYDG